jgi:hypothetical protein
MIQKSYSTAVRTHLYLIRDFIAITIAIILLIIPILGNGGELRKYFNINDETPSGLLLPTDQTRPSVSFTGLRHYERVNNQVSITVNASDDIGVSRVEIYLDGVLLYTNPVSPAAISTVVNFSWNTLLVANGKHMLVAKAYDAAGNSQTAVVVIICVNASLNPTPTPTPSPTPSVTPTPTPTPLPSPTGNSIVLNPSIQYQVMGGWEATGEAAQFYSAAWNNYKTALVDQAVNDLGLNRLRVEVTSGAENPVDYFAQWRAGQISESTYNSKRYEIVNDDSDPNSINASGFKWSQLDATIDGLVVPMRQRLQARGETLWVNICYVDFGSSTFEHKNNPSEYAEFVLAAYQHIQSKYGFVPDSWEVILEPDTGTAAWSALQVAQAIKAAGDRLTAAGFTPNFVAPSTTNAGNAPIYVDQIAAIAGAMQYVGEFSYHRYCCATTTVLQGLSSRALQYNKRTAMLEWIGADYNTLHEDLKLGRNSTWQQFTLAGPLSWGPDSGDRYYLVDDTNVSSPVITMGSRTKFLRQYFKFVRSGARRIDAASGNVNFDPLAFINTNGKYAVVVKAAANGSFTILGLPPGNYGIKYTTSSQYNIDQTDVTVNSGQGLTTSIPAAGVITVYGK